MKPTTGQLLIAVGVIHNLFGLVAGLIQVPGTKRKLFAEIINMGVFNSIDPDPMRMALFWFIWFGWAIILCGMGMHHLERTTKSLPQAMQIGLVGLCVGGCVMMPISGFWLALAVAIHGMWRYAKSNNTRVAPS